MIKYLFVTINSIALFFYSLFFDGGVSITGNIPASINPGSEANAEIIIKKGSIGGFAKLQIEVPQGFTVKESDSKGATFSFAGGIAKWIWTGIPSDAEFPVKFILQVDASVSGMKTVAAKYSYVENNNKQVVEMTPVEVRVGDVVAATPSPTTANSTETKTEASKDNALTSTSPSNGTKTETPKDNAVTTTNPKTETTPAPPMNSSDEPNSNVTARRTISKTSDKDWTVSVKIRKDGIKGFARYSENLPEGFTAKKVKTEGGSFSVADKKIKFVWVTIPKNEEIEIAYILTGTAKEDTQLEGEFSYLENNQSKAIKVAAEKLSSASELASTSPSSTTTAGNATAPTNTETAVSATNPVTAAPTETKTTETSAANTASAQPAITGTDTKKDQPAENKTSTSNPPETNVNSGNSAERKTSSVSYCVQIGAYTNAKVTDKTVSSRHNLSEPVRSEMADGFTKFLVGNFDEYKLARNHRETVKGKGVKGAFVAAYNGPKRITVQEALMVSNQKWYR